ncbi:hypothetical protein L6164_033491 [Bauhinia variegata]|uniref:Uncharacterized protein n=1 Tax=Bauhinia variegata TaxID=167791 RepID=A0ACB9KS27_BAUVA|nr:hypothetical protein L6164_033491 [Bauhinia variegata]
MEASFDSPNGSANRSLTRSSILAGTLFQGFEPFVGFLKSLKEQSTQQRLQIPEPRCSVNCGLWLFSRNVL